MNPKIPHCPETTEPHNTPEGHINEYQIRCEKITKMNAEGINPWPAAQQRTASCQDVIERYQKDSSHHGPDYEHDTAHVAGRVMAMREHGKTIFFHIQDFSGKLQLYCKQDVLGDVVFAHIKKYFDIGDQIYAQGAPFVTKTGEITLRVDCIALISKCLHPLPEKFHGLTDVETRYRQRYLDLIMSADSRERLYKRSTIIKTIRQFMDAHHFTEVETPMLHPIPGGAIARPFVTHHNALDMELYLRIAPELYLKKLVVGGIERVYEINRCFRNEGISTRHNPEFTTIELYAAHLEYHYMMGFVEELLRNATRAVNNSTQVEFGKYTIEFGTPFIRMTMKEAVLHYLSLSADALEGDGINQVLQQHDLAKNSASLSWGQKLNILFEELVQPHLIQPTFIIEFPIEVSPLAKRNIHNPSIADRFELFIAGMEISNGFNELNDPIDQASRFKEQAKARAQGDLEAHYYDADFITALEYGLPPTVGVGIGIDRLAMLLTNTTSIRDVILFPALKARSL